jgi:hypothetical protein
VAAVAAAVVEVPPDGAAAVVSGARPLLTRKARQIPAERGL